MASLSHFIVPVAMLNPLRETEGGDRQESAACVMCNAPMTTVPGRRPNRFLLDLIVESHVVKPGFESLFTADELRIARSRFAQYGYQSDPRTWVGMKLPGTVASPRPTA